MADRKVPAHDVRMVWMVMLSMMIMMLMLVLMLMIMMLQLMMMADTKVADCPAMSFVFVC